VAPADQEDTEFPPLDEFIRSLRTRRKNAVVRVLQRKFSTSNQQDSDRRVSEQTDIVVDVTPPASIMDEIKEEPSEQVSDVRMETAVGETPIETENENAGTEENVDNDTSMEDVQEPVNEPIDVSVNPDKSSDIQMDSEDEGI
jgi:hypothetical protein